MQFDGFAHKGYICEACDSPVYRLGEVPQPNVSRLSETTPRIKVLTAYHSFSSRKIRQRRSRGEAPPHQSFFQRIRCKVRHHRDVILTPLIYSGMTNADFALAFLFGDNQIRVNPRCRALHLIYDMLSFKMLNYSLYRGRQGIVVTRIWVDTLLKRCRVILS